MYGSHQSLDYGDFDSDTYQDGERRPRANTLQALGRTRRVSSKKRVGSRKRTTAPILGISHRRNHKWTW